MKSFVYILAAVLVVLVFASPALATGHGQQQAFIQQQYIAVPQAVIVPQYVQQQNAACVVEQFNAYSVPLQQQQFIVRQNFKQQGFQRSRSRQQFNSGGRSSSLRIERSSSGGGVLRNILPF